MNKFSALALLHGQVVCYCLMPNHFHFMINATESSAEPVMLGKIQSTQLSNGFRRLCSTYANYFNKKYGRSGSLFRQKTKAKPLESEENYPMNCFHYIHQNPLVSGLCWKMGDWEYSSFKDYCGLREQSFITKTLAYELIGISERNFYEESYQIIDEAIIDGFSKNKTRQ